MNKIEEQTLANVRETLNSPEKLSEKIPPLPAMVIKLLEVLKDSDANFLDFVAIIEQDPALAVQVIRVANTAKYARGDGPSAHYVERLMFLALQELRKLRLLS